MGGCWGCDKFIQSPTISIITAHPIWSSDWLKFSQRSSTKDPVQATSNSMNQTAIVQTELLQITHKSVFQGVVSTEIVWIIRLRTPLFMSTSFSIRGTVLSSFRQNHACIIQSVYIYNRLSYKFWMLQVFCLCVVCLRCVSGWWFLKFRYKAWCSYGSVQRWT